MKLSVNNIGGYHPNPELQSWPMGSIFENEGKKLYELVLKFKPKLIVEIGGYYGCSTTWLAFALKKNKTGKLISIDNQENLGNWSKFPEELKPFVEFVNADAFTYEPPKNIDMVFEDGAHSPGFTRAMINRYKPLKLWVSHDYMHNSDVGRNVKADIDHMFGGPDEVFFEEPSDCGLAIKYI